MSVQLLIPAAGMGQRLGAPGPKALIDLEGKPLLVRTLERFTDIDLLDHAIITIPAGYRGEFEAALTHAFPQTRFTLIDGGVERQDSVDNGLAALDDTTEIVVIHDAARPFVPLESIRASIEAAREFGAATVAIPCVDTILVSDHEQFLVDTPPRSSLWACQTPQTFRVDVIREAHARARREQWRVTDDATVVRQAGGRPKLVMGSPLNFKVTTPTDWAMARFVVREGLA